MTPHDLIQKHLDASLTAAEAAELAAAMAENPALAEEFAAASRMDAALSAAIREDSRTALYTRRFQRTAPTASAPRKTTGTSHTRRIATAAAIAALLSGAWWALPRRVDSPALPVAEKKKSAPKVMESAAPAPAFTGGSRAVAGTDSAALRRTLRQFQGTGGNVRSQPVSQALAALEATWKEHAPKDMAAIPIRLSEKARQRYARPEDEPLVSLEIPGASLLANLNLLAAQAGLKAVITSEAVTLEPEPRSDDGTERTWTLPLDQPTLAAFIDRAGRETALASWMPKPEPIVLTGSGITEPIFATRRWKEVADSILLPEHPPALVEVIREFPYPTEFDPPSVPNDGVRIATPDILIEADSVTVSTNGNEVTMTNAQFTERNGMVTQQVDPASDGKRAEIEAIREFPFPTEFDPPQIPKTLGGTPGTFIDVTTEFVATGAENGSVDLNLAPEVVEFEGFINYSPLSRAMTPTATLLSLLAAHGLPSGASYDAAAAQLTAKATLTQLRTASAAVDAVKEAANRACSVKFRVIKWPAGTEFAQASRGNSTLTESSWQTEMKTHGGMLEVSDSQSTRMGAGLSSVNILAGQPPNQEVAQLSLNDFSFPGGTVIHAEAVIVLNVCTGGTSSGDTNASEMQSNAEQVSTEFQPGDWRRWDFPAKGDAPARTVLLSVESAQVPAPGSP